MSELWTHKATLRSGVLLVSEDHEFNLRGIPRDKTCIHLAKPKRVENAKWLHWDHNFPNVLWDYDLSISFSAKDEKEAGKKAWVKLESIAARLSFLSSAPVTIESYGSITTAPEPPIKGVKYKTVSLSVEQVWEGGIQPNITESDIQLLTNMLVPDTISKGGTERIERSMRWLQHSHFAANPTEEFMYLMLAFEAVSHLLEKPKPNYWHCETCNQDAKACPHCGASTEWAGSGNLAMRRFVCTKLAWQPSQWKQIWALHNSIFHGALDLTSEQQQAISGYLKSLEGAVVSALKYLLNLTNETKPTMLRRRGNFYGMKLHVEWTAT